jgi:hypothetical protein
MNQMSESGEAEHASDAALVRAGGLQEAARAQGRFDVECFDKDGRLKWRDTIENVVTTVGKNLALDTFLAGAGYTVVGPFMGLISSVSYGAGPVVGDSMGSHAGWTEAGAANAPTYTAPRKTCAWSAAAAGAKALSAALAFVFTGDGTVKGCFLVYGTGAVSTIDNTSGILYSGGLFTGGDKIVVNTDTLNVTYTASM